jgi:hypothetical protein
MNDLAKLSINNWCDTHILAERDAERRAISDAQNKTETRSARSLQQKLG